MTSTWTAAGSSTRAWAISLTSVRISETGSEGSNVSVTTPPQKLAQAFSSPEPSSSVEEAPEGVRLRRTATRQREIKFKTGAQLIETHLQKRCGFLRSLR